VDDRVWEREVTAPLVIPRTVHEIEGEAEVEMEMAHLGEEAVIEELGRVLNVVKRNLFVVRAIEGAATLSLNSIVCLVNKEVVGLVDEVIGPTSHPFYSVKKRKGMEADRITKDLQLYFCASGATFTIPEQLYSRGCDASNVYDEEVDENDQEFSDDEKEKTSKRIKRNRKKSERSDSIPNVQQPHLPSSGGVSSGYLPANVTGHHPPVYTNPYQQQPQYPNPHLAYHYPAVNPPVALTPQQQLQYQLQQQAYYNYYYNNNNNSNYPPPPPQ
jgi:H/ACA ribonucleoprotein complex non-core subunit NAF1